MVGSPAPVACRGMPCAPGTRRPGRPPTAPTALTGGARTVAPSPPAVQLGGRTDLGQDAGQVRSGHQDDILAGSPGAPGPSSTGQPAPARAGPHRSRGHDQDRAGGQRRPRNPLRPTGRDDDQLRVPAEPEGAHETARPARPARQRRCAVPRPARPRWSSGRCLSGVDPHDVLEVGGSDRGVQLMGLHHRTQQLGGLDQRRQVLGGRWRCARRGGRRVHRRDRLTGCPSSRSRLGDGNDDPTRRPRYVPGARLASLPQRGR